MLDLDDIVSRSTRKPASKPAASKPAAKKPAASKPASKPAVARVAAKTTAIVAEARRQRAEELCGSKPGGVDAYYYSVTERCTLKKQNADLMRRNRNAVSFVNKTALEMPVLDKITKEKKADGKSVTDKEMQVALLEPTAVERCVAFMTAPENNTAFPNPEDRLRAAMAAVSVDFPVVAKNPLPFRKLIARNVYATFAAAAKNVAAFKGRPAMRKGAAKK